MQVLRFALVAMCLTGGLVALVEDLHAESLTIYEDHPTLLGGTGSSVHTGAQIPYKNFFTDITEPGSGGNSSMGTGYAQSAEDTWDISASGFQLTMDHNTGGYFGSSAFTQMIIFFSFDCDMQYTLSGQYEFSSTSTGAEERVQLNTLLSAVSGSNRTKFGNHQESRDASNGTFTVGEDDGTHRNSLSGSLTGTLDAGRIYGFYVYGAVHNFPEDGDYAILNGDGSFNLTFTNVSAVPEPGSLALMSLAVGGLIVIRRSRKRS